MPHVTYYTFINMWWRDTCSERSPPGTMSLNDIHLQWVVHMKNVSLSSCWIIILYDPWLTIQLNKILVFRVTYESYGSTHKTFFLKSKSRTYKTLGQLMYVGVDITDGLRMLSVWREFSSRSFIPQKYQLWSTLALIHLPIILYMMQCVRELKNS